MLYSSALYMTLSNLQNNLLTVETNSVMLYKTNTLSYKEHHIRGVHADLLGSAVWATELVYIEENPTCRPTLLCVACSNNCRHL